MYHSNNFLKLIFQILFHMRTPCYSVKIFRHDCSRIFQKKNVSSWMTNKKKKEKKQDNIITSNPTRNGFRLRKNEKKKIKKILATSEMVIRQWASRGREEKKMLCPSKYV